MPKVVINAMLASPDAHGIGQYARMLVEAVGTFTPSESILALAAGDWRPSGVRTLRLAATSSRWHRLPAENLRLPLLLRRDYGTERVVFHNLDYGLSPIIPKAAVSIVTVHDVAFVEHPEFYGALNSQYKRRRFMVAARRADLILTDSENVRQKILDVAPVVPDRVRVLYPGIDPVFTSDGRTTPHGAPRIGYLGQLTARKNLETLVRAFGRVGRETEAELWLAGVRGLGFESIQAEIDSLPDDVRRRVHLPGRLPRAEVAPFLRSLSLFVFPSWAEGFGFPPIEAMACGTPVVVSDAGSLPEIVADAGLIFAPSDEAGLVEQMSLVLKDRAIADNLVAKGVQRAAEFSWQRFATSLIELYEEVAA